MRILCRECGQVEHDEFNVRCHECHNQAVAAYRAARKQQLAEMPRCECCGRRGTWKLSGVLLCGIHKKRVQQAREHQLARHGEMALVAALGSAPLNAEQIREMAVLPRGAKCQ